MNKAYYYLVQLEKETTPQEFAKLTSALNSIKGIGINTPDDQPNTAILFYEQEGISAKLQLVDVPTENLPSKKVLVECELVDMLTIELVKSVSLKLGFRAFKSEINYFLPESNLLVDCDRLTHENHLKAAKIMKDYGFKPIFCVRDSYTYFAQKLDDNTIHIINDNLLYFLIHLEQDIAYNPEFNYEVASDIANFVQRFNVGLIPTDFYKYYESPFKIINYSGFNIESPGRKVFIKPLIFEFNKKVQDYTIVGSENSSIQFMDKIRPGESLHDAILRILRTDLKLSDDYVGAVVGRIVDFDFDKENILTPRLNVKIFISQAKSNPAIESRKNRSWVSLDDAKERVS